MLGNKQIEIPKKFVETLREWNIKFASNREYDNRIIIALLLICVDPEDLSKYNVGEEVKKFMLGRFEQFSNGFLQGFFHNVVFTFQDFCKFELKMILNAFS